MRVVKRPQVERPSPTGRWLVLALLAFSRPVGSSHQAWYAILLILQWLLTFSNEWDYRGYIGVFAPIRKYRG
jgi:hypothetical protein